MVSTGSLEPQQVLLFCRGGKSSSVPPSQKGNLEAVCIKEEPTSVYMENLVKVFATGRSWSFYEGQIPSFLGPNGGGKSSTMLISPFE
ncbi:phospholipid-transporting ATPase ABCA1-like isoform X2 [Perca fluviatilis]|uniref:phospholipid-transporting ATPase ABCA1-like isoform X2 n=1 Tax=Perca fluviatilis TaxID=8168 RepID=UPI001962D544|nr:phospholipid-transporting ATPase ABCA1-like isoform X2 [Perca fluviatilis]